MINSRILSVCLVTLFLAGCSHEGVQLPEIVQVKKISPYHKVSNGDTIGSIAQKYGMSRSDLIKLNKLEQPYQLYDGQRLIVTLKPEYSSSDPDIKVTDSQKSEVKENSLSNTETPEGSENNEAMTPDDKEDKATIDDIQKESVEDKAPPVKAEYTWPVSNGKNKISQHFGANDVDGGIIIDASVGTPVKSIADGVVMISGVPSGDASAYGKTVVIKHVSKKTMSIYANLKETNVTVGQKVKQGGIIGKVGQSGTIAKKPQLYFEINDLAGKGRKAIDPEKLLSK